MKKPCSLLLVCCFALSVSLAQTSSELQETARAFMKQGDYVNAAVVLTRALQKDAQNIGLMKDLSLSQYYQGEYTKAMETLKPALESEQADDQAFQIAGNIYRQSGEYKEAEKLYKKALKKFAESGALYNDLGEVQQLQQNRESIRNWEKGIEVEPSYSRNYYNAARYYFNTGNMEHSVLCAEIFLNMEPFSSKSPEIKQILLDGYKQIFSRTDISRSSTATHPFYKTFLQVLNKQSAVAAFGLGAESMSMIRTRFILDWFSENRNFPFALFDYHQQLLRQGLFDAYNQWLFAPVQNLSLYQQWMQTHPEENKSFYDFQKSRVFKMPGNQFYH